MGVVELGMAGGACDELGVEGASRENLRVSQRRSVRVNSPFKSLDCFLALVTEDLVDRRSHISLGDGRAELLRNSSSEEGGPRGQVGLQRRGAKETKAAERVEEGGKALVPGTELVLRSIETMAQ